MAGFKEIRFPPVISLGAVGGLEWKTRVVETESGESFRDPALVQPLGGWDVAFDVQRSGPYKELRNFFMNVRGQAFGFRFKDWTDYTVEASESAFSVIDSTHAQLAKRYATGAEYFDRKLSKIVAGTFTPTGGSGLSLDYNTGILTHSGLPSAFVCEFDVPVRLGTDSIRTEIISPRRDGTFLTGWKTIPIRVIRA